MRLKARALQLPELAQKLGSIPLRMGKNVYLRDVANFQDDTDITYGYALVFQWTAAAGLFAVLFVLLEWLRVGAERRNEARLAAASDMEAPVIEPAG